MPQIDCPVCHGTGALRKTTHRPRRPCGLCEGLGVVFQWTFEDYLALTDHPIATSLQAVGLREVVATAPDGPVPPGSVTLAFFTVPENAPPATNDRGLARAHEATHETETDDPSSLPAEQQEEKREVDHVRQQPTRRRRPPRAPAAP